MIFLLFPHQLFRNISLLRGKRVLLIEEPLFFSQYSFHIQKITLHRASMKAYEAYLKEQGIEVLYIQDESYLEDFAKEDASYYDVVDYDLQKKLQKYFPHAIIHKNPNFLNVEDSTHLLHSFYVKRRKELRLFVDEQNKPCKKCYAKENLAGKNGHSTA